MTAVACVFCETEGGEVLFRGSLFRIVWAHEPLYPGFLRLIWNGHAKEMTDLTHGERTVCFQAVCVMEEVMRECIIPHKVNVASLGNVTPHLHWHVIPRFHDDAHFPDPVWGLARRPSQLGSEQLAIAARAAELQGIFRQRFADRLNQPLGG